MFTVYKYKKGILENFLSNSYKLYFFKKSLTNERTSGGSVKLGSLLDPDPKEIINTGIRSLPFYQKFNEISEEVQYRYCKNFSDLLPVGQHISLNGHKRFRIHNSGLRIRRARIRKKYLRIRNQYCGSGMFIPDPGSRIRFFPNFFHPGSASKKLSILTQKWFLSSYDPGCSSGFRFRSRS